MTDTLIEVRGYWTRAHSSLIVPILIGGCQRELSIVNWTVTLAIALGYRVYYIIPLGIVVQILGMWASKYDPDFFSVLIKHLRQKPYYEVS